MGCTYKELKSPWSHVRVTGAADDSHCRVALWVNAGLAGELCVRREELPDVLQSLTGEEAGKTSVHDGVVYLAIYKEPRTGTVISEYNEIHTWNTLKQLHPRSPVVELDNLIQWGRKASDALAFSMEARAHQLLEDLQGVRKTAKQNLDACDVPAMKESVKALLKLQEHYDRWVADAQSS